MSNHFLVTKYKYFNTIQIAKSEPSKSRSKSAFLNQESRRNLKVKKYSEGICCTLRHESSFLRTLILKEAPLRQKSQSMGSHAVPAAEGEIQSRHGIVKPGHCSCSDSISLLNTQWSSKHFNEIHFRAAAWLLSLPQNLPVRLYCTLQNWKDLKHSSHLFKLPSRGTLGDRRWIRVTKPKPPETSNLTLGSSSLRANDVDSDDVPRTVTQGRAAGILTAWEIQLQCTNSGCNRQQNLQA